jgi:tetratricopeptide (TPR) repeat protein
MGAFLGITAVTRLACLAFAVLAATAAHAATECAYRQAPLSPGMLKAEQAKKGGTPFGLVLQLKGVTENEPGNALAWRWRSDAEREMGDYKSALVSIDKTLALNPCDDGARLRHGMIAQKLGGLRQAYDDYSALIAKDPHDAYAHELRGGLLQGVAELSAALADFDAAVANGKPGEDLLLNRGGLMQEFGRYREAIADYERILKDAPDDVEALAARGYTRFFLEDFSGAAADLQAPAKENYNALAWRFLAQSRAGSPTALDEFSKDSQQTVQWMQQVAAHFRDDTPDEEFARLAQGSEQLCAAWFYVGEIALSKQQRERAKAAFLRASDECPIDPVATQGSLREYVGATEELKRMR